ncbi:Afadin and alpha-actinin-binding-domain-containing protein [Phellopilus nigrolimitatus]|nr:Afadin and alpha-actinin-binding-domain-containing protein [Phellopilus nigrolimitatus]
MACTPRKLVHWGENDINEYAFGSPYSEASSSDSINATSTLQYINSQLVAHGFTRSPGVSFEGLSKEDADRLSKCVLGMLSQRMDDMARAEDISAKFRTLSYEHERLSSMLETTSEQLASSERETNLFKSRLAASNKALQASEAAHKATSAELQRTRTSMQSVRQTHAAELKRREKETEKILERWQKISDAQTKLSATAAGLKFKFMHANPMTSSRDNDIIGSMPGLLEDALQEAEASRKELVEENSSLKNVVLSAANELIRMAHSTRLKAGTAEEDEVPRFTLSDIFTISAPESASEKFNALLWSLHESLSVLDATYDPDSTTPQGLPPAQAVARATKKPDVDVHREDNKEMQRLQNTVIDLRRQLDQAQTQTQSDTYTGQAQAIIRRFVNDDDNNTHVQEKHVLEKIRKELDNARRKVDEAALTLRDEKEMLEEERQGFLREQHLWRSQMCIPQDPMPSSRPTGLGAYFDAPAEPLDLPFSPPRPSHKSKKPKSPKKSTASPRKQPLGTRSPAKPGFAVGKMAKKGRGGGNTPKKSGGSMLGASTLRSRVIPPMETEVIPTAPMLSTIASSQSLIVPNSFVLPPPSPMASIPHQPNLLSSLKPLDAPSFDEGEESAGDLAEILERQELLEAPLPSPRKPFPVAKPFAQHMIHAYSPARPSPLSRILLLASSPSQSVSLPANGNGTAPPRVESEVEGVPAPSGSGANSGFARAMTLEEELGIEELTSASDESPLREKNIRLAGRSKSGSGRPGAAKSSTKDKGKAKAGPGKTTKTNKENGTSKFGKPPSLNQPPAVAAANPVVVKPLALGGGKGGARRVPIGSADAAPMWK